MGLLDGLGWWGSSGSSIDSEIPDIFPMSIAQRDFVLNDLLAIYEKILTDVFERSTGLTENAEATLWDSYVMTDSNYGLISLLAIAMREKTELFLVYDATTGVLRKAKEDEVQKIRADYMKQAESPIGVYVNFQKYCRTDMVMIYSALEYFTVSALHKSMNISKAVQIKIKNLRATVNLADVAEAKNQAKAIAEALKKGRDTYLDAEDMIENAAPDLTATEKSMNLTNQKRAFYLGYPASYITGELNAGLGDSGAADAKAIERGHRYYFYSIVKPICKALFGIDVSFKSENYDQIDSALNALKTFTLTDDTLLSADNKTIIVNRLFGLEDDEVGDPPTEPPPTTVDPVVTGLPIDPAKQTGGGPTPPPAKTPFQGGKK